MSQFEKHLPDITAKVNSVNPSPLKWVGMEAIDFPIEVDDDLNRQTPASINTFVDLRSHDKGIHMSRLYLKLQAYLSRGQLSDALLDQYLDDVLTSHVGKSRNAKVSIAFDLMTDKPALKTQNSGFHAYAITWTRYLFEDKRYSTLEVTIPYSSTCPNSAALARQLTAEKIDSVFDQEQIDKATLLAWLQEENNSLATPHNQRSFAHIVIQMKQVNSNVLTDLIRQFETAIGTPLQTAVKRIDEQAFAELNGNNLLFCEDAARRIKQCIANMNQVEDYWFKVEHQESLHPHNAVAIDFKHASSASLLYI